MQYLVGAGTLLGLSAGCSGGGPGSTTTQPEATGVATSGLTASSASTIHRVVAPSTTTALSITTLPNAHCTLANPSETGSPQQEVASDSSGEVRFFAQLPGPASVPLTLSCEDASGSVSTQQVQIDVGSSSTATPAPPITPRGKARPALAGDPMSYSQSDLALAGYGLRPDPSSAHYAQWLEAAQQPTTLVEGPGITFSAKHGDETSGVWSGCRTTRGGNTFLYSYATWTVPPVTGQGFTCTQRWNYSSIWVGLDGWGNNDVDQTGTDSDVFRNPNGCYNYADYSIWYYYAWVEFFPNGTQWVFNVNPGDQMTAEAWFGYSNGTAATDGTYGWYYINDSTSNTTWTGSIQIPGGVTFHAATAEWILEDPVGASVWQADYNYAYVDNLWSYDLLDGWQTIESQPISQIDMTRGSTLLAQPYCGANHGWYSDDMLIHWNNF
jgi:hypothetical protein